MIDITLGGLLGQPDVSDYLRGIVQRGRYANAYLFHGPAGVGKCTAALAFARAVLCERVHGAALVDAGPSLFGEAPVEQSARDGNDACGECRGCRLSGSMQHPDLQFLFPLSGEEKTLETTVAETLQAMRDDPLYVFQYEKAASIRISQTRELLAELGYRPHTASRRVVVVRDCDRMREDQFSALLKSVEEPGASTIWVLTTARLSRVPVTIRSRCQRVRFAPLPEALIRQTLQDAAEVDEKDARMLAALSGGSLARALAMRDAEPSMLEQRDAALALLSPALSGDMATLWKNVQGTTAFGKAGRERLRQTLEFHQLWLRDILRLRYGAGVDQLVNRDKVTLLQQLATRIDASEIRRRLMVLEEALRSIDGNISPDLTLFSTLSRVGGQRLGEGVWPAHATARWDV
ncbi:MAG: DNA polymerase III subunit delta' C-terminal domain-containing protein [Candidatus Eisenbacteria bacterium]